MKTSLKTYLNAKTSAAPLAVFRIGFGLMMFYGILRFWAKGWIQSLYIDPQFHFSYYGFSWVKPIGEWTYGLFVICGLAALMIAIGFKYRWSMLVFFLSFTYIELMDKTTYLNHYYFISAISFLMIFLPLHKYFSIDSWRTGIAVFKVPQVPQWSVDTIKLMLGIVYFYAGLAKINSDWLIRAMPLRIWLPSKYDLPLLGELMEQQWVAYAFSWSGMIYDLSIPFLLLYKKTRPFAFIAVVVFHVLTRVLFPIGMFPYVMIVSTLIFFSPQWHERFIGFLKRVLKPLGFLFLPLSRKRNNQPAPLRLSSSIVAPVVVVFFAVQLLLPWRYLVYPDELFWTEEGYRFSWRVMLMEKMGHTQFRIEDAGGRSFYVNNADFLTPLQEKQMSFQPDFILEYAHYLGDHFTGQGYDGIKVFADSHVALNGRMSRPFIDDSVDLYAIEESLAHKNWILDFEEEIDGL
ncbi:HTTM domain-containing protein [Nonlabens xiamenensis]|uniref:HTTM domain-containing protein n=1 Tax=Nonlabens xiamenensis TaxID=2341043 RepID=UPI000F61029A|nr:HTTM domain-containing protein [Nonlabens xiamenensis]